MSNTLQGTINWSQSYIEYSPMTAGTNFEPAVSIASMIRNTMLSAPFSWAWNRKEDSSKQTQANVQDYSYTLTNFGYLEKASLIDSNNKIWEIKDVYNTSALSKGGDSQRPHAIAVIINTPGTGFTIRFMGIPDDVYTIVLTYQILSIQFASFAISSAATASGGNTVYTGVFDTNSFPVGSLASVAGFIAHTVNNGTFKVVAVTATTLTLANSGGLIETIAATAVNQSWAPIPDNYSNIYNNLFLGEAFASTDDTRSQTYRQRGVAALLAKSEGLTDTQKNIFAQQWLAQGRESGSVALKLQQGIQAHGI